MNSASPTPQGISLDEERTPLLVLSRSIVKGTKSLPQHLDPDRARELLLTVGQAQGLLRDAEQAIGRAVFSKGSYHGLSLQDARPRFIAGVIVTDYTSDSCGNLQIVFSDVEIKTHLGHTTLPLLSALHRLRPWPHDLPYPDLGKDFEELDLTRYNDPGAQLPAEQPAPTPAVVPGKEPAAGSLPAAPSATPAPNGSPVLPDPLQGRASTQRQRDTVYAQLRDPFITDAERELFTPQVPALDRGKTSELIDQLGGWIRTRKASGLAPELTYHFYYQRAAIAGTSTKRKEEILQVKTFAGTCLALASKQFADYVQQTFDQAERLGLEGAARVLAINAVLLNTEDWYSGVPDADALQEIERRARVGDPPQRPPGDLLQNQSL